MGAVTDAQAPQSREDDDYRARGFKARLLAAAPVACHPSLKEKLLRIPDVLQAIYTQRPFSPRTWEICPTSECNMRCPTCIDAAAMTNAPGRLDWSGVASALRDGISRGVPAYKFAGYGEPTLESETLERALRFLADQRLPVSIITNGLHLTDKLALALVECASEYRVSIPTLDEPLFSRLMRPKAPTARAEHVLRNIERVCALRERAGSDLLVGMSVLLYESTFGILDRLLDFAEAAGVDYILVKPTLTDLGAIGFRSDSMSYCGLESLESRSTQSLAVIPTKERFASARGGRPYDACRVAGIAPMALPSAARQYSTWVCGRGKGRAGFEAASLTALPARIATSQCPPVCKEDAYNLLLEDPNIRDDIQTRGEAHLPNLPNPRPSDISTWLEEPTNSPRHQYLRKRLAEISSRAGPQSGARLAGWLARITDDQRRDALTNLPIDNAVLDATAAAPEVSDDELRQIGLACEYATNRRLVPARLEAMYSFF